MSKEAYESGSPGFESGGDKWSASAGVSGTSTAAPELWLEDFVAAQHVEYVSPRSYAHELVEEFLSQHLSEDIDPDDLLLTTLFISEQDHEPQRANVAQSMTLTDALMSNYQKSGSGDWWDHLGHPRDYKDGGYPVQVSATPLKPWDCYSYDGIYRKTSPQRFDRSTQIALDPKTFKQFVWDADLQPHYEESLIQFWDDYGDDYNMLIKAAFLKSAYVQYAEGSLSADDKALVLESVGLDADQPWETLSYQTFADAPLPHTITFRELIVYRYVATDIIVIRNEKTDRLVMYIPGNSSPLHGFKDLPELSNWFALQCKDSRRRKALESHFRIEDDGDGLFISGVHTALAGLAVYPHFLNQATGYWNPATEIHLGNALSPWPFSSFRQNLQERFESDGLQLTRNRDDYYKEAAAQFLRNAILDTGMIAMVAPYLWIPLAVMSVALIGLGADEVVEGKNLKEKKKGTDRVVFGVLNAVPAFAEGGVAVGDFLGAAAREGDQLIAGATDETGQMIASRSPEQQRESLARQQQSQAQSAEDALGRANESASGRNARLVREEQQRLVMKTHRETGHDSVLAFGVEPEGLRSLTPELRTALARFEFKASLDPSGVWKTDDFGAVYQVIHSESGNVTYYARVHSKIYSVERVDAVGQYRICSPDDAGLKGPYIKRVKGYYSDIDLNSGLRGGDSYIEELAEAEAGPQPVKIEIALTRAQPPVTIEVPMDGIEPRLKPDRFGNQTEQYFALDVPEGSQVFYNADEACWVATNHDFMWFNNEGRWMRGGRQDYLKTKDALTSNVRTLKYKFRRLPGYPASPEPIKMEVHQIWLGNQLPNAKLIKTIKANMLTNPDFEFTLHIDIDDVAAADGLTPQAQLEQEFAEFPKMTVSTLQDEPFFKPFATWEQTAEPYSYFRRGNFRNLAAASDVLRYRLIREYGGIYVDCDDVMGRPLKGFELTGGPNDVMVGTTLKSPNLSFEGPGNSHFASHSGNPVLKAMEREISARFAEQRAALEQLDRAARVEELEVGQLDTPDDHPRPKLTGYMTKISELTGPKLFIDVLRDARPDYAELLDDEIRFSTMIYSDTYGKYFYEVRDFYRAFSRHLKIRPGTENSWKRRVA